MNHRTPFACGQSSRLVSAAPRPVDRYATWDGEALREAARRALAPITVPEHRQLPEEVRLP